jgi:acetolactate synthase I/II/III large subunit
MTDQTTAAPAGPGLAGSARKGPSPTPRDLAARAASRDAAESHPGPAGSGPAQPGAAAPGERPRSDPAPRHDAGHRDAAPRSEPAVAAGTRMTGASALVAALEQLGVDVVFGIPGGAILPLYDPLFDSPSVRHILVRHEQGAGHAATGYAQVTGRPGVCMATSGPGATNLVTPLSDAYMDSVPVVAITGQVASSLIGTDGFQEADISGITLPITKHNFLVTKADDIARTVAEAFHVAATGRPCSTCPAITP